MITFNLQWLAVVPAVYAMYVLINGIAVWTHYLGSSGIGPMIGNQALFNGVTQGIVFGVLAWLVYRAFRP